LRGTYNGWFCRAVAGLVGLMVTLLLVVWKSRRAPCVVLTTTLEQSIAFPFKHHGGTVGHFNFNGSLVIVTLMGQASRSAIKF
jgi:hypothetical protein